MNLNQLRYFVAVAEYRSFTKAANQYYISQTAITQQIQALEDILDVKLVDRSKRPICLTAAGKVFLPEAKAMINRAEFATKRVKEAEAGGEEILRIGYTKGYEGSDLPLVMQNFHKDNPDVLLTCFRADTDFLAAGILNGDYDVIFTWDSTNILEDTRVGVKEIEKVQLMASLYKNHPLAGRKEIWRSDLAGERLLFMSPSGEGDTYADDYYIRLYQQAGYNPNIFLRTSDLESVIMMVEAEVAVSILPEYCSKKFNNTGNIVYIPLSGESEFETIHAVWLKEAMNPHLERFLEYV